MAEHPDVVVNFSNSDVRIIENTPARVIVHWRYAPVSAIGLTWNIDEKTGSGTSEHPETQHEVKL